MTIEVVIDPLMLLVSLDSSQVGVEMGQEVHKRDPIGMINRIMT